MSLKSIRKILALKCSEAAPMISEGMEWKLSRTDRIALKMHLISCNSCRRFRRQILFLRSLLRHGETGAAPHSIEHLHLSSQARLRLEQQIQVASDPMSDG